MLNMFMFDVFSVCHSFNQSVKGKTLFIFWLKSQEFSFSQKSHKLQYICMLNMFCLMFNIFF